VDRQQGQARAGGIEQIVTALGQYPQRMRADPDRGQAGDEGQVEHEHHDQALHPGHLFQLRAVGSARLRAMLACLIALAFAGGLPAVRAWSGTIEQAFYLSAIAWFAVFAAVCATWTR